MTIAGLAIRLFIRGKITEERMQSALWTSELKPWRFPESLADLVNEWEAARESLDMWHEQIAGRGCSNWEAAMIESASAGASDARDAVLDYCKRYGVSVRVS